MNIRRACEGDTESIMNLLSQVLEVHAWIRPDVFLSGTTKYSAGDLARMYPDDTRPIYVAEEGGRVLGYAFCQIKPSPATPTMVPHRILYIDDICVDAYARRQHVGLILFDHVKQEARRLHCDTITLNVWEGNDGALKFYQSMGMKTRARTMEYDLNRKED